MERLTYRLEESKTLAEQLAFGAAVQGGGHGVHDRAHF